jgi:hypothetical protein
MFRVLWYIQFWQFISQRCQCLKMNRVNNRINGNRLVGKDLKESNHSITVVMH